MSAERFEVSAVFRLFGFLAASYFSARLASFKYYVWKSATENEVLRVDLNVGCLPQLFNLEARLCSPPKTLPVELKLSGTNSTARGKEYDPKYFLFGNLGGEVGDVFRTIQRPRRWSAVRPTPSTQRWTASQRQSASRTVARALVVDVLENGLSGASCSQRRKCYALAFSHSYVKIGRPKKVRC